MKNNKINNYIFLVGAGISIDPPSNIPDGGKIIDILLKWIARNENDFIKLKDYKDYSDGKNKISLFDFLRFELLLKEIYQIEPEILDMLSILENGGFSNTNHYFLSAMIKEGATVLTTNFDNRIEDACEDINYEPTSLYLPKLNNFDKNKNYNYIKLHGTFPKIDKYNKNIPVGTLTQIGKTGFAFHKLPIFKEYIEKKLIDKTLIVIGYSASDSFDVVPLLEDIEFKQIIWLEYSKSKLSLQNITPIDSSIFPDKSMNPFQYFLSTYKFKFPKCDVKLYNGKPDDLYKILSNDLYLKALHNASVNYDDNFKVNAIKEFEELLYLNPLDKESKSLIIQNILNDKYGEWRNSDDVKDTNPINIKIRELLNEQKILEAKNYLKKNKTKLTQSNYNITLAEIYLEEKNYDLALKFFEKETFKGYKKNVLGIIENRISLYIDFFDYYYLSKKFKKAMSMANKIIKHSLNKGVIWGVVEGSILAGVINEKYSCSKYLKYSPEYYIIKALADFSLASYYALRISRLDLYFQANRYIFGIYQTTNQIDLAIKIGENLISILPYAPMEEQASLLTELINIYLSNKDINKAEELHQIFAKLDLSNQFVSILYQRSTAYILAFNNKHTKALDIIKECIADIENINDYWDILDQLRKDLYIISKDK